MAATDSIRVVDDDYVKRIHSRTTSGHLHKGHGIVAATASIPSKYQTIVTDNSDKRGFGGQAKRFQSDYAMTDAPGPGSYVKHSTIENNSVSFSKKGTGGFASKSKKGLKYIGTSAPGPGIYCLPNMLRTQSDFNRSEVGRLFQKPIAHATELEMKEKRPAPNQYQVSKVNTGKTNNVSADAAFKSKSKRELMDIKDIARNPAPGQYSIKDHLQHESVKVPFSSFKSKSKRQMQPSPVPVPGPGAYKPNEPIEPAKKQLFPRKHYLCISAPAMPLPNTPPQPGPAAYDLVNYEGPPKHYMSSSAFVSTTSRWTGNGLTGELPGPAHYRPVGPSKQSFIYNAAGKWI
uniref:O(6)-methylguanine-induced apoptosis 2-like n=1 Tax=Crassostrea virginica TaxID=6565 RepID=A0A8B8CUX2_CRAVI|nr:O(6)-methylguanine-induced apoptosis 2-like [Crassostrea virginica]XP_022319608.1 O(6)-methylguanine-induced apoptosis 2-like [Crassostrea virginica]